MVITVPWMIILNIMLQYNDTDQQASKIMMRVCLYDIAMLQIDVSAKDRRKMFLVTTLMMSINYYKIVLISSDMCILS